MESSLLKEPWAFPSAKTASSKKEDSTEFSIWEENFQDLSGWCMDPFQGQYDFPIGESTPFKLLGTKYEGDCASTSEEGALKEFAGVSDEEKWSLKMDPTEAFEHPESGGKALLPALQPSNKVKQELSSTECSGPGGSWLNVSRSSVAAAADTAASAKPTATATWSKQNGTDVSAPFHPGYHIVNLDLDDACPTSFDSAESQREPWDVLRTIETTGSDTFDLLSYLCDDEMRSSNGSTSTDSVVAAKPRTPNMSTGLSMANASKSLKARIERRNESTRRKLESRLAAAMTSSSAEISLLPSRRSERTRTQPVVSQPETSCPRERRERHGKKRYIESDSDDQMSTSSYRESREKNNEASRKSRMNKKAKESEMAVKAIELERDNRILKMKVEELEKLVTSMRNALLRSALKKEF